MEANNVNQKVKISRAFKCQKKKKPFLLLEDNGNQNL